MQLTLCDQPWFELQLEYGTKAGCCCYWNAPEDDWTQTGFDIARLWNSPLMRRKRAIIAAGDPSGTGCAGCQFLKYGSTSRFATIPAGLNPVQRENWERALESFAEKRTVVDAYPVKYYFNFGLACNLDCIHCSQTSDRGKDRRQLPAEQLLGLKEHLRRAHEFAIIGGEPLAVKNSRRFIEAVIGDPDYSDVLLTLYTNGTLLHQYLDKLESMRRVAVCVSLESSGRAFDYIRKGGNWETVERNILAFKERGKAKGLDWRVNVAAVVLKSSLANLTAFVDWCIRHEFPVHFVPMQSQTHNGLDTDAEDIFNFPAFLDEIPGWEGIIDDAIEKLTRKGWFNAGARPLGMMKDELLAKRDARRQEERIAALRARIGVMLERGQPISPEELVAGAQALERILRAPDLARRAATERHALPAAMVPLLDVHLETARAAGNATLATGLAQLRELLAGGPAPCGGG